MATESIMRNIVITNPKEVEVFVNAMEQAMQVAETPLPCRVKSRDLTPEEVREFISDILSNAGN